MAKLKSNVWVGGQLHRAGSTPPAAVAARIRNPGVWDGEPPPSSSTVEQSDAGGDADARVRMAEERAKAAEAELEALRQQLAEASTESPVESQVQEPPRGGAGSGVDVWRAFLTEQKVEDLPADASRDDLVALWDARKIQG